MDFWYFLAFVAGIGATLLFFRLSEKRALSIVREKSGAKGLQAKQDQAERLMQFMTEVKSGFDAAKTAGKSPKDFAMTELPAIALRYPDVVLKFGGRLYKMLKEGEGIDGVLEGGLLGGV